MVPLVSPKEVFGHSMEYTHVFLRKGYVYFHCQISLAEAVRHQTIEKISEHFMSVDANLALVPLKYLCNSMPQLM